MSGKLIGYLTNDLSILVVKHQRCSRVTSNLTGRVGSGQEVFEFSRVGPDHPDPTRPGPHDAVSCPSMWHVR